MSRIVGKIVEFVSNSVIIQDIFKAIVWLCGKVWDIISAVFSAVETLFNKIILPALQAIEKAYRWLTGRSDEPVKETRNQKPEPKMNQQLVNTVNRTGAERTTPSTVENIGGGKGKAESVATGGKRSTTINITLRSLVERMVFEGGVEKNSEDTVAQMSKLMLQVLNMSQASVS